MEALAGQAVGVSCAVTFDQAVAFEFAQIVAKLVETVGLFGKLEALENDLMNLPGAPAAEIIAGVQKNLQEPDDACLMDLYTRIW